VREHPDEREQPKLLYPDILWRADFCVAAGGFYTNNTTYLLPSADNWLLACLNSPAIWSYLWRTAQHAKDEALRMFGNYVVTIPIATPAPEQRVTVELECDRILATTQEIQEELHALYPSEAPGILEKQAQILAHERSIAESVHAAFGLTAEDLALLRASQPPRMPPGW
jgi:hypothetical protein